LSFSMTSLIPSALDPRRTVVVEACAGSGKTWLLASRIVRLLLDGVAPGEILAITFTRKAAREIEERVMGWLRDLASGDEAAVCQFLAERSALRAANIQSPADAELVRRARGLYEQVATGEPSLAVHTFHGWFLQLLAAAPLQSAHAGASLVESVGRLLEEVWSDFAAALQAAPDGAPAVAFRRLLDGVGLDGTRKLVLAMVARRAEWAAYLGDLVGAHAGDENAVLDFAVGTLAAQLGAGEPGDAQLAFFAALSEGRWQAYLGLLESRATDTDKRLAATLRAALAERDDLNARFAGLCAALLTKEGAPRARKPSKTLDKEMGSAGAETFLALHAELAGALVECLAQGAEEQALAFNRDALTLGHAFVSLLDRFKAQRRLMDFSDAEWRALDLLRHPEHAALTQARLDARYKHLLLDEFQDTNPLQWHILLAWLDAYDNADEAPRVFLVGDPKQSIYRFRRAEPRLFEEAATYLEQRFGAVRLSQDATRRNAPAIVEVVNQLFGAAPVFQPFRPQSSFAQGLPGRIEILPPFGKEDTGSESDAVPAAALRDPLTQPESEVEDARRRLEGRALASRLQEMVGHWLVRGEGGQPRTARYGDVMLLVRRRTQLAEYERALREAGIPYLAASRGGLLTTLEALDIAALLKFLVLPADNLALAQALRAPLFDASDAELLALSGRPGATWWERLSGWPDAPLRLARAASLLGGWLRAADRLPAHDLLDRIYHQGDLRARYAAAVPPAMRAAVDANLTAILDLALDLDGGRYPSLPRFIDELATLADADGDEAPDEGLIESDDDDAGQGRVRILTIHAAKGLEAPIVWLLDAHAGVSNKDAYSVLVDWPPGAAQPTHFSLLGRKETRGRAREPLFEQEQAAAAREELNLLYVAITRAKQVFVASGVQPGKDPGDTFLSRLAAAVRELGHEDGVHGEALAEVAGDGVVATAEARSAPALLAAPPAIGERRGESSAGAQFGTLLHAALEDLANGKSPRAASATTATTAGSADEAAAAEAVARRLIALPAVAPFFDAKRIVRAWNEVELADVKGDVRRADRVVEFFEEVWVLDYKSGTPDKVLLASYRQQVAEYMALLAPIFAAKPVRGALLFADGSVIEACASDSAADGITSRIQLAT
jgi:ATP-dependent helicase/nuclease subunit A